MRTLGVVTCLGLLAVNLADADIIPLNPPPVDVWFHFEGTWEAYVFETEYIDGEDQGTFVVGSDTYDGELWVGMRFHDVVTTSDMGVVETTATGSITMIDGTPGADVLSEPMSPFLVPLLYPEYYLVESEALLAQTVAGSDHGTDLSGVFSGDGISLDEFDRTTFIDSGFEYDFDLAAQYYSDGTNTVLARESLETVAFTFDENGLDGFITRYIGIFEGTLTEYTVYPGVIPEPATMTILGLGLGALALRRRYGARR